jgi:hypothetical protein
MKVEAPRNEDCVATAPVHTRSCTAASTGHWGSSSSLSRGPASTPQVGGQVL